MKSYGWLMNSVSVGSFISAGILQLSLLDENPVTFT
jgi:hypothetical protein